VGTAIHEPPASTQADTVAASGPITANDRERVLRAASTLGALGDGGTSAPKLLSTLCSPTTTAREITQLLGREPALAARVLRIANSPFYGQSRTVHSIEKAIVLLGLDAIRGIVAAACLDRFAARQSSAGGMNAMHVVAHSLATAAAADALAAHLARGPANDAFLAGLLHNLGVFVQLRLDADRVGQVAGACARDGTVPIRQVERSVGIVTHEECFAVLADAWQLPVTIALAGAHHHDPREVLVEHRTPVAVIGAASRLALHAGFRHAVDVGESALLPDLGELLGVEPGVLEAIAASLPDKVRALGGAPPAG
jgi:HD-like signal output (HDOD) protein